MEDLERVWILTDDFFQTKLPVEHRYSKPIQLRNPFIFYYGHLPSFSWNTISKSLSFPSVNPYYDTLFSRGVDPDIEDPSICHDHPEAPSTWPQWHQVQLYTSQMRHLIRNTKISPHILRLVTEHEAMHVETLFYMLAQLDPCANLTLPKLEPIVKPAIEWIQVPAGETFLGVPEAEHFVWDNEQNGAREHVKAFQIAKHAISIADFSAFVAAGGYENAQLWTTEDWAWIEREKIRYPRSWRLTQHGFELRSYVGFGEGRHGRWDEMGDLPVSVSLAEARAYARWVGAEVISEAEWVYAAYGPVGARRRGVANGGGGRPEAVRKGEVSWSGAVGMVGNGWEMTRSVFEQFEGFESMAEYEGYSSDFFDGKHFVLRGASWASDASVVRASFRNFYQARYPYVFSKIRLIRDA